jgi:hypothetical protein
MHGNGIYLADDASTMPEHIAIINISHITLH